ncbi:MAG: tRNA (adenosine(37)-N6)-dimethylallyltransferase MiaA [Acholeplasmataceae bacterium]|jgi:tRNA dimethylallyltransferase|nr:tRNA (adenosine(37)-N6)-dimethylallyltransferase MiaA [Acholeplasmataceae bacterium]
MKKVIVIVGPTASGKTGLSIQIAKHLSTDIINGDSVQVYKGLDIGSAKIKSHEMMGITHHLLDVVSPNEQYSVFQFQHDVRKLIDQIKIPLIVGGTGLYIKAALYNYEFVEQKRNDELEKELELMSNEVLYEKLIELDPDIEIDQHNRRRLTRAYEQALLGYPRSEKNKKNECLYDPLIIYLDLQKDMLEKRLIERLESQIKDGFIEEVKHLLDNDIHVNAIGYREIEKYLNNELTLEEAKQEIIRVSKKLAKKQKTWFKNQMNPTILDALSPTLQEDVKRMVDSFIKGE